MSDELVRSGLWGNDEVRELKDTLERAREHWQIMRRRRAIGSQEELQAWKTYRTASDRLWELIQ